MTTKVEFFSSLKSNQVLCTKQIINIDIKLKKVLQSTITCSWNCNYTFMNDNEFWEYLVNLSSSAKAKNKDFIIDILKKIGIYHLNLNQLIYTLHQGYRYFQLFIEHGKFLNFDKTSNEVTINLVDFYELNEFTLQFERE